MRFRTHKRRTHNKSMQARRSGFTLLELLLVMAILVVLASLSTVAIFAVQRNALKKNALIQIKALESACGIYRLHVGQFPASLDDLHTNPSGMSNSEWGGPYMKEAIPVDPWRRAYTYSTEEATDRVIITSAGPDGQAGTEDDVPEAR